MDGLIGYDDGAGWNYGGICLVKSIAAERFSGFSDLYDTVRPAPPKKVCTIVLDILNRKRVERVVDLGCGTGLSTAIWRGYAGEIIGIEPNEEMRALAAKQHKDLKFIKGSSYDTTIADAAVDIVTCSQSFHWMEPVATLAEIDRILQPNGILVIYDCKWPVTVSYKSEISYSKLFRKVAELHERYKEVLPEERQWPKNEHLHNLERSGFFAYCTDIYFENKELCDSKRFIGMALSQGQLQTLVKNDVAELGEEIKRFEKAVAEDLDRKKPMLVSYKMIVGLKKLPPGFLEPVE
jgi:ubiquinone/menaquinone biosynthesis C-methylase UbiE